MAVPNCLSALIQVGNEEGGGEREERGGKKGRKETSRFCGLPKGGAKDGK